ncbi:hypothetical protein [Streptomyces sp. NPDC091268]|uniref:hypothetical protein n=1 Tax=Streptomyces sp. NPDC091268 TaxID=3365979 RepID=UPI0038147741
MDQGLAAVLGAAVGVTGTLGTAVLTYLAARRQAVDQGKVDHEKALREERRLAYLSLMQAAEPADRALHRVAHRDNLRGLSMETAPDEPALATAIDELGEAAHGVYRAHAQVDLVGPHRMSGLAIEVWAAIRDLRAFLEAVKRGDVGSGDYQDGCERAVDYVERARTKLANGAREVLALPPGAAREAE